MSAPVPPIAKMKVPAVEPVIIYGSAATATKNTDA